MLMFGCALPLAVAAAACGGGSSSAAPAAPTPAQAAITVTVSPNPITATVCSPLCVGTNGANFQFRISGTLVIQETAGIGGNVDSIAAGGLTYTSADLVQRSGTSRVPAKGSLPFPLAFVYGAEGNVNAVRAMVIPLTVSMTDDRGNHVISTVQWTAN